MDDNLVVEAISVANNTTPADPMYRRPVMNCSTVYQKIDRQSRRKGAGMIAKR